MGDPFETFLQDFSPSIQDISMHLRATIQKAAPEAKEVFSEDLRHLSYSYSENTAEPVLLLAAKKDFVLLVFKQCKRLRDPEGLLGNMGKPIGFMTLRTMEDADRPALKELIKSAWSSTIEQPV